MQPFAPVSAPMHGPGPFSELSKMIVQADSPVLIIQFIGIIIPLISILLLFWKEQTRATMFLLLANASCLVINSTYFFSIQAHEKAEAMLATKLGYMGNTFFFLSFALFVAEYLQLRYLKYLVYCSSAYDLFCLICLWANNLGNFAFKQMSFQADTRGVLHIQTELGIPSLFRYFFLTCLFLFTFSYTFMRMKNVKGKAAWKSLMHLIIAQALVLVALFSIFCSGLKYNPVPLLTSAALLIITMGMLAGHILAITDMGRQWVIDHTDHLFLIVDSWNGFLDANETAKKVFPFLKSLEKNDPLPQELCEILLQENDIIELEGRSYSKKIAPIKQRKKRAGYSVILIDITEEKKLLDELQEAKAKAEEANEAKSAFMSNMSHEIRTPMNAIVGMTDILLRSPLPDQEREYLQNIKSSGNALLSIINDILDFSKIESGKLELVEEEYELMSMLNDLGMIFLNRIGNKPVELLYDIDPALPYKLYGDSLRLRQVIINITNNAIKFTDSGFVKLTISVKSIEDQTALLYFSIRDSGQGIRKEDLGKLFHSFEQVDTKKNHQKEGTGLGLAISRQLVELMGGSIDIESEYGKGSNFFFTIPQQIRSKEPAARLKEEVSSSRPVISGRMHSPLIQDTLQRLAAQYQLPYISYEELTGENSPAADYFFTDCYESLSADMLAWFRQKNIQVCHLHNPMRSDCYASGVTTITMPLYTLNFCQTLNHETVRLSSNEDDRFTFEAPKAKILAVDDNEMNLKVILGLMEPLHAHIDTAENGKQALQRIQKEKYDLILMDHMMPIMDGVEAAVELRAMDEDYYQSVPVIALTANAVAEARQEFLNAGMNDFLAKPVRTKELCRVIRKWLPAHLIKDLDAERMETESQAASENQPEDESLPEIEGLSIADGIRNSGSKKLFLELLGDFYQLIDRKATKIKKCLADGMLRDYTIEVHALKNTARMIGALELSDRFYYLEQMGNEENLEELEKETPGVLELYQSYKPILKPFSASNENKKAVSTDILINTLQKMQTAMDQFDLDGADEAMKELETYQIPSEYSGDMENLRAYVADVAMEEVLSLTKELIHRLSQI